MYYLENTAYMIFEAIHEMFGLSELRDLSLQYKLLLSYLVGLNKD